MLRSEVQTRCPHPFRAPQWNSWPSGNSLREVGHCRLLAFGSELTETVLEIGCFTGYSAMAWYESTATTQAEVIFLELDPKMIAASRKTFDKYKLNDRVTLLEGPAQNSIERLSG